MGLIPQAILKNPGKRAPNNLLVVWSSHHESGIKILDEQHHVMVGLMNSLYFSLSHNLFRELIAPLAEGFVNCFKIHHITEEELLEEAEYRELEAHRLLHRKQESNMAGAVQKAISAHENNVINGDEILACMKDYWLNHVCREDKKFMPYLREHLGIGEHT